MDAGTPPAPWPDDEFVDFAQARQHGLLRAAYLVTGDLRLAEQLVLDALVRLARQWVRVREEQPDLFVRRLVYRDAVAAVRRRGRQHPADPADPAEPADPAASGDLGDPAGSDDADASWGDEDAERRAEVLRALGALPARQRAVVVIRWFEERGEGEAAQVLGCSASAVRAEGEAALVRLRNALPRVDLDTGGVR